MRLDIRFATTRKCNLNKNLKRVRFIERFLKYSGYVNLPRICNQATHKIVWTLESVRYVSAGLVLKRNQSKRKNPTISVVKKHHLSYLKNKN